MSAAAAARTPSPGTTTGSHAELPRPPTARAASRASHRRVACRARWERPARRTAPASSLCAGARSHAGPLSRGRSAVPRARESPSSAPPGSSTPPRRSRSPPTARPALPPGLTAVSTRISNAALIRPVRSPTRVPSRWPRPRPCGAGPAGASRCRSADVVLRTEQRSTRSQGIVVSQVHRNDPPQQGPDALVHRAGRLRLHVAGGRLDPQHIGGVGLRDQPAVDTEEGIAFEAGIQFCAYHRSREPPRFCSSTRSLFSGRVGTPAARRSSESGSPPDRASFRLARSVRGPRRARRVRPRRRTGSSGAARRERRQAGAPPGRGPGTRRAQRERRRQGHEEHEERDEQYEDDGRKGTKGNERVRGAGRDHVQERGRVGSARCRR